MKGARLARRGAALAVVTAMLATGCVVRPGLPDGGNSQGQGPGFHYAGDITLTLPHDPTTCDPLGGARCLLPFPNDHFTVADHSTDTGRRLNLALTSPPVNVGGTHV